MIACIDIDGVLSDLHGALNNRLQKIYGLAYPVDRMIEGALTEFLSKHGINRSWLGSVFRDEWFWGRMAPFTENIEPLHRWVDDGVEIHIVTGRPRSASIPTTAWLKKHDVPYHKIIYTDPMQKYRYMMSVDAAFIVEDLFYEAYKCSSYGFPSFVVRRPYNIDLEPRVINKICRFIDDLDDIDLSEVRSYVETRQSRV